MGVTRKLGAIAFGLGVLVGSSTAAGASDYNSICTSYWQDTTQISAEEADLEYAAAVNGQSVEEFCATHGVTVGATADDAPAADDTPAEKTKKLPARPGWVSELVESKTAR